MRNAAVTRSSPSRLAGLVGALDRAFPLLWIGLYLLLPVSGWAAEMFESWNDQQRFLQTLQGVLDDGRAPDIDDNVIGPAYIAAAAAIHALTGLDPADSLIALNRLSYVLAVAAGLVLVRVLVLRWVGDSPVASLATQLVLAAVVFAGGTWYWSDVPWTHFFAMFLAVGLFASRFAPKRHTLLSAAAVGALAGLLAATRSFEFFAVVLVWVIVAIGFLALRLAPVALPSIRLVGMGSAAFLGTTGLAYLATGKRSPFLLYSESIDRQAGSVTGAELLEPPTLALELLPTKLVQLFVDPCYLSYCEVSDYQTGGGSGQNIDLWSLPLAVQLPALVLLPACLVCVGALVVMATRRGGDAEDVRQLRVLVEMTLVAAGLVLGYAASTRSGPAHLRYGFARDFLLPELLTAIVATALTAGLAWRVMGAHRRSRPTAFVASAVVLAGLVVGLGAYGRSAGLPRIDGRHITSLTYEATCKGLRCAVRLDARRGDGARVAIPEASTLAFGCGTDTTAFTVYAERPADGVPLPRRCLDPRLVAAWPTVMGLPPGSFEFAAVDVRNA